MAEANTSATTDGRHHHLLDGLIDFTIYKQRVEEDYRNYSPHRPPRYLPLRTDLQKYFVPLACKGDYNGGLFPAIEQFLRQGDGPVPFAETVAALAALVLAGARRGPGAAGRGQHGLR